MLTSLGGEPPGADANGGLGISEASRVCGGGAQVLDGRLVRAAACVQVPASGTDVDAPLARAAYDVDSVLRLIGIRPLVILIVGAYYTLLLAVSFVPAHLALQQAGRRIRDRSYPPLPLGADGYKARLDERSTADRALGLDAGPGLALRQHIALLAPLGGGIVSALLAGRL